METFNIIGTGNKATFNIEFDSLSRFVDWVESSTPTPGASHSSVETGKFREKFTESKSMEHAIEIARAGWPEGAEQLKNAATNLKIDRAEQGTKNIRAFDVAGAFPDVPSYVAGAVDHMVTIEQDIEEKIIKIAVNVGGAANVPAKQWINRGAALINLIDDIESNGVSVELYAVKKLSKKNQNLNISINLKQANEPLDYGYMSFALCHPAMARRFSFKVIECLPNPAPINIWCKGYGLPIDLSIEQREPYTLYLHKLTKSNKTANQWHKEIETNFNKSLQDKAA